MKVSIYPDYDAMSKAVADLIVEAITRKPAALCCFPSGDSPTGVLRYLVQYAREGKLDCSQVNFVGLDEWVGMDGRSEGSCRYYMDTHLFQPLEIAAEKIHFFNGCASDPDAECKRMDDHIGRLGPIDIMLVGLGLNGHIGLNEPGADPESYAHHMPLDPQTVQVAQKYFSRETPLTEGITLGLRHFREAVMPILIASGGRKAAIIARSLEGTITNEVPATILQTLPTGLVYLDQDAAGQLGISGSSKGSAL